MIHIFEKILDCKVFSIESVAGGDINKAYRLKTSDGSFFAKVNGSKSAPEMLATEAKALNILNTIIGIKVPQVILLREYDDFCLLILEWIDSGKVNKNTYFDLALKLASLHKVSSMHFGLDHDNFIGSLPQVNTEKVKWLDFYYLHRISPQLKRAVESGQIPKNYINKTDTIFRNIENEMPQVEPSLIHGDLWCGNFMADKNGNVVFIDPAISYSHREMDIAMMKLFGGFDPEVFEKYNELLPLDPGWKHRLGFYQLYYILVHVNLFGSAYSSSAKVIIDSYI